MIAPNFFYALRLFVGALFAVALVAGVVDLIAYAFHSEPPRELACGEDYDFLPDVDKFSFRVPVRDCFTHWQVRPKEGDTFWMECNDKVEIVMAFTNGATRSVIDQPGHVFQEENRRIARARFRNLSSAPLTCSIALR